jgi:hypothetical protein
MKIVGEGTNKTVYQLDDGESVLKIFKNPVDIETLRNARVRAEKYFGDSIPKLYCFTNEGIVEEYCGRTINSSPLSLIDRMKYAASLIRFRLRHYVEDFNIGNSIMKSEKLRHMDFHFGNFTIKNGELKYIDWDELPSETSLSFCDFVDVLYFVSYEAIKILERNNSFRKIQRFYRTNILPKIRQL